MVMLFGVAILLAAGCGTSEGGRPTRTSVSRPATSESVPDSAASIPDVSVTAPDISVTAPSITAPDVSITLPSTTEAAPTTEAPTTTRPPVTLPPTTDASTTIAPTTEVPSVEISGSQSDTTVVVAPDDLDDQDDSSTTWIWILVAILAVTLIGLIVFLLSRRRSHRETTGEWEVSAGAALDRATTARAVLAGEAPISVADPAAAVTSEVTAAGNALEHAATNAPGQEAADLARGVAAALRNTMFAREADQLLREGAAPTGEQLAAADLATRTHMSELDASLRRFRAHVTGVPA
jgi:hypothetical protein